MAMVAPFSRRKWAAKISRAVAADVALGACIENKASADSAGGNDWMCLECDVVFSSRAAYESHRYRTHGFRNVLRYHISETWCPCCLMQFHTRERVIYHLKKSVRCQAHVLQCPALTPPEAEELDAQARIVQSGNLRKGLQPRHASHASHRIIGPLPMPLERGGPPAIE